VLDIGSGILALVTSVRASIARRLAEVFDGRPLDAPGGRRAAVALVIGEDRGTLGFLLTQRAAGLARHAGQYALPGGRMDDGEGVVDAALRELREELGLALAPADVLGRLPDYRTGSGFCIAPIVVWADDLTELRPDPGEVAAVHHIALSALQGPGVPRLLRSADSDKPMIQMPLGGDRLIHAPTGAILHQFAEAALAGRYVDAQAFAEPAWARR
jgi:8-oxo-dGTP pyrophosphatase MutT (NUDIX family)